MLSEKICRQSILLQNVYNYNIYTAVHLFADLFIDLQQNPKPP